MAVSKRLRFEIFRRDNHTCYYCGRKPPEVELTVDHVVPRALGGEDVASNLVAACTDCNGGKTSIAPNSPLVARVDEDAARWSAAVQAAIVKANADHEATVNYRSQFLQAWNSYRQPAPLDELWRPSVESFRTRGLPIEILVEALHRAMAKPNITSDNKFRYMCGIAWKKISEIEKHARVIFKQQAAAPDVDVEDEDYSPTLVEELLPLIGQYAHKKHRAAVLERHADYDDETPPTEEELEQEAIVSALYALDGRRFSLRHAIERLLWLSAPAEVEAAGDLAEDSLRKEHEADYPGTPYETELDELWNAIAVNVIEKRSLDFMASASEEARIEWRRHALSARKWGSWGEPTGAELEKLAGEMALRHVAGWRFEGMCFRRGDNIPVCPERATARIGIAGCTECGHPEIVAEVGLLICDRHLEAAIERGLVDGNHHTIAVTDFVVLPPEEEPPF